MKDTDGVLVFERPIIWREDVLPGHELTCVCCDRQCNSVVNFLGCDGLCRDCLQKALKLLEGAEDSNAMETV